MKHGTGMHLPNRFLAASHEMRLGGQAEVKVHKGLNEDKGEKKSSVPVSLAQHIRLH